jgi:hypothetical protein
MAIATGGMQVLAVMLMLSSEQLGLIQGAAALLFLVCLGGGALYLLAGLIQPAWVLREKRRWVAVTALCVWLIGAAAQLGAIAFTHSHPNGPHAFKGYFDRYIAEECAKGADLPACRQQPAAAPEADALPAAPH